MTADDSETVRRNERILSNYDPTTEDLSRASTIAANACPRRYCWWWKSLGFEWEISARVGCTWPKALKPAHWKYKDAPCCRADSQSSIDQYEPRGLAIETDGINADAWMEFRSRNHQQYPGD